VTRRERRERRKDIKAAHRLIGIVAGGHQPKTDDELLVEAWLWMVAGEDTVSRVCLDEIPAVAHWRRP
jgi:cytochrome P450